METTNQKMTITEQIIDGLKKAAVELEEFRLQVALGKAEGKDLFEEVKKKFKKQSHDFYVEFERLKDSGAEGLENLKPLVDELKNLMSSAKAETKEVYEEQRKNIKKAIKNIESYIAKNHLSAEIYRKLLLELKKLRIKLDILRLRYELNKTNRKAKIAVKKNDFGKRVSIIKDRLKSKEEEAVKQWKNFNEEMHIAYAHLKKAFAAE